MKNKTILILLAVALLVGIAVVWLASFRKPGHVTADLLNPEATTSVGHLVESEETLLGLTPTLRLLSQSVLNLKLPDENAKTVFSKHAKFEGELESTSETELKKGHPNSKVCDFKSPCSHWTTIG